MKSLSKSVEEPKRRFQFRIAALLILTAAVAVVFSLVSIQKQQDDRRRNALSELQAVGLNHSVGRSTGTINGIRFFSITNEFVFEDGDRIVTLLKQLQTRYDLGLTKGNTITEIDFANSEVPIELIDKLRNSLPGTTINVDQK